MRFENAIYSVLNERSNITATEVVILLLSWSTKYIAFSKCKMP